MTVFIFISKNDDNYNDIHLNSVLNNLRYYFDIMNWSLKIVKLKIKT